MCGRVTPAAAQAAIGAATRELHLPTVRTECVRLAEMAQFIGLKPGQVPKSIRGWLKLVHPDDRHLLCDSAIRARRTAARTEAAYRLQRGDAWIHVHHVMDPLPAARDSASPALSWFHTLQDISDWKQATFRIQRLNRVLTVLSAIVENGPVLKRFKAGAKGTAMPRRKKMSHIRIVLSDGNPNQT